MFQWYSNGGPRVKLTFWGCFLGWALDTYDLQIFSFFLPTLAHEWGMSSSQTGLIGTAALLSAAVGGWIAGILSDRVGRVPVLLFTIVWFTLFGVIAGFSQNYHQLLIARTLQGLGFGGEWAVGAALMAEVISPENRGRAMGFVQSGFGIGWAAAALVATWLIAHFPGDIAWRMAFWLGVIPAAGVFALRCFLEDSHAFLKAARDGSPRAGIGTVFSRPLAGTSILAAMLIAGLQAGAYIVAIWLPTLLSDRGVATGSVLVNILVMALGTMFGFAACAYASDRFGRRLSLAGMVLGAWIVTLSYMLLPLTPVFAQCMGFLVGFFTIGSFAVIGPFLSELFPTFARTTCMGFSYNVGKTLGAMTVTAVGVVSQWAALGISIALFSSMAYALAAIALLFLRETKGLHLDAQQGGAPVSAENPVAEDHVRTPTVSTL